jgi:hypothetical protein
MRKKLKESFEKNLNKHFCTELLKQNFEGNRFGKTKN